LIRLIVYWIFIGEKNKEKRETVLDYFLMRSSRDHKKASRKARGLELKKYILSISGTNVLLERDPR